MVLHDAADLSRLRLGLSYVVRIADLVRREAQVNRTNQEYAARTGRSALPSGRDSYRTLAGYSSEMAALARQHPTLVKGLELPLRSLDGKTVKGIEIGRKVRSAQDGRPTFVILGLHHAREWPSGELTMEFAYDLVKNYGRDARITRLLNKARVVVVPVVNVDGFDRSRTDGGLVDLRALNAVDPLLGTLLTPGNAYKRKNCRLVDGSDTPDGHLHPRRPARAASASASTRTATTAATGADRAPPTSRSRTTTAAPAPSPSRRPRTSGAWSAAARSPR